MCGICGIKYLDDRTVAPELLQSMTDVLKHRGPDDEGFFINSPKNNKSSKWKFIEGKGNVGFGHRRLSIIDLSTGHQPLANEDHSIWVTYNGEIYNFQELRDILLKDGHQFRTHSDTEVIVHAYEKWGEQCVEKFRGMFAFALWDENKHTLFLARDRVGIKPLYYYVDDHKFLFASEIKAIIQDKSIAREINLEALSDYFSFLYVPAPKSIFKNIFKLLPGHTLTLKGNQLTTKQYWDIRFQEQSYSNEEEISERIITLLNESVAIRLVSEVPLGAFLSGGVDSSAVVAMMAQNQNGKPVKTCSIGFNEKKYNEIDYARIVAGRYKTDHKEYFVTPDAVDILDKLTWYYDEPFADSSAIPTYYVSKLARENVTVALSGDGGDENFAGYFRRYYYDRLENQVRRWIPYFIRKYGVGSLAKIYPKADWLPQPLRAKTLLTNLSLSPEQGYFNTMTWFNQRFKQKLFNKDTWEIIKAYNSFNQYGKHFDNTGTNDPLSKIQYVDIKTYLVDDILTKVDRASMANSLEVRVPILDHQFMELAATIPSSLKLNGKISKYIFKKSLKNYLLDDILYRGKMGFSIPLSTWLKNDLKHVFEQNVLSENSMTTQFLDMNTTRKMWQQHLTGLKDYSTHLWSILFFEKWAHNYLFDTKSN